MRTVNVGIGHTNNLVVNGPGEAREADVGIAGGKGEAVLIKKGEIVGKIPEDQIVSTLIDEVKKFRK